MANSTKTSSSSTSTTLSNPNGVTGKLCNWIYSLKMDDVPQDVQTRAKYLVLDGIACAIVGSHLPWSEIAAKAIYKMEPPGSGSSTVIGWNGRNLSPMSAALLNSTFIQGFELDDYHSIAPQHSNAIIIPALFSASKIDADDGVKMTGKDFLLSYIIGCEIGPRVGEALHGAELLTRGWHSGALQGPTSSAGAVSKALHLEPYQIEDALGIACTQAGGLMAAQFGSMAKRMQHGFPSRNGLFSVLLAREGYTGIKEVYETPYGGFLSCFGQGAPSGDPIPEAIIKNLGSDWELWHIQVKLHACMAALQSPIDCVENLQKKHPEKMKELDHITKIETKHSKPALEHGGWKPSPDKPLSSLGAQMCIPYATAAQLVDGEVLMAQFASDKLHRPIVKTLMEKVDPSNDPRFDSDKNLEFATEMTITFDDGTVLKEFVKSPRGVTPPCSNEDIVEKWRSLVRGVLDDERRDKIEKCVLNIETLEDIDELLKLLEPTVKSPIT